MYICNLVYSVLLLFSLRLITMMSINVFHVTLAAPRELFITGVHHYLNV